jgi:hypothetical protein
LKIPPSNWFESHWNAAGNQKAFFLWDNELNLGSLIAANSTRTWLQSKFLLMKYSCFTSRKWWITFFDTWTPPNVTNYCTPIELVIRGERLIAMNNELNNLPWCSPPQSIQQWHRPPCIFNNQIVRVLVNHGTLEIKPVNRRASHNVKGCHSNTVPLIASLNYPIMIDCFA